MSKITIDSSVAKRTLEALTSYCNTGEIDGADDILASLLYEVDHADSSFAGKIARDAFIDLARQAGFKIKRFAGPNGEFPVAQMSSGHFVDIGSELATFAKLVIAALEQPQVEQEPYAWMSVGGTIWRHKTCADDVPLYTHPQPPRQPLTEDGIKQAFLAAGLFEAGDELVGYEVDIARAIEAAHGIGGEA